MIAEALKKAVGGQHLTADETHGAFREIMDGAADPVLVAALLTTLQVNGPTAEEVTGAARAMRAAVSLTRAYTASGSLLSPPSTASATGPQNCAPQE